MPSSNVNGGAPFRASAPARHLHRVGLQGDDPMTTATATAAAAAVTATT
jgi:hypothetical protein